jgi:DNA/RNA-binding domain of Phe-tRNA-synthetase-like protein
MPTNDERADWADDACDAFCEAAGYEDGEPEVITDLVTNLLHLAHRIGMCPESLVERALMHFEDEMDYEETTHANV